MMSVFRILSTSLFFSTFASAMSGSRVVASTAAAASAGGITILRSPTSMVISGMNEAFWMSQRGTPAFICSISSGLGVQAEKTRPRAATTGIFWPVLEETKNTTELPLELAATRLA